MAATKIEWCDRTINPVTGCLNGCPWCYARPFARRLAGKERTHPGTTGYPTTGDPFKPTFHPDKIKQILDLSGRSKRVFLDSMGDWFSAGVEHEWIRLIVESVWRKPDHSFFVLTKRPGRIAEILDGLNVPDNLWLGTSITQQEDLERIDWLRKQVSGRKFLSIEPLHGPIEADLTGIDWVIIGAETGNRKSKIEPKPEWIIAIKNEAERVGVPLFLKGNLWPYLSTEVVHLQQFPQEARHLL